mmetsp:Transcript_11388/g.24088  ORF Transcript_11388/g.24088 Transcript_11388/m.24088 type:complete len:256 (+) Transcript_11388:791-1558(+)
MGARPGGGGGVGEKAILGGGGVLVLPAGPPMPATPMPTPACATAAARAAACIEYPFMSATCGGMPPWSKKCCCCCCCERRCFLIFLRWWSNQYLICTCVSSVGHPWPRMLSYSLTMRRRERSAAICSRCCTLGVGCSWNLRSRYSSSSCEKRFTWRASCGGWASAEDLVLMFSSDELLASLAARCCPDGEWLRDWDAPLSLPTPWPPWWCGGGGKAAPSCCLCSEAMAGSLLDRLGGDNGDPPSCSATAARWRWG